LSISVRLRNLIRPDTGWSAIEEEEEVYFLSGSHHVEII
jgi:hypothetical protein